MNGVPGPFYHPLSELRIGVNIILAPSMVMKELLLELLKKCEHPPTNADLFPAVACRVDRESDGNISAFARVYVNTGG